MPTTSHPHTCNICNNFISSITADIRRHYLNFHSETRPFPCPDCSMRFQRPDHLDRHQKAVHRGEKPFSCPHCPPDRPSAFASQHQLTVHIRTHTGERPFSCDSCGQRFVQSAHLATHQKRRHNRLAAQASTTISSQALPDGNLAVYTTHSFDTGNSARAVTQVISPYVRATVIVHTADHATMTAVTRDGQAPVTAVETSLQDSGLNLLADVALGNYPK
ncbi:C2H2-type zinc finger protein [Candidatus Sororendozoicomonas aggregata]|uniref:C2H2-type zinc finger protein n=1 Tax=Candidatus Sororendozoicomonas aggregata TaxID=3073239 RepID=UPI002ED51AFD